MKKISLLLALAMVLGLSFNAFAHSAIDSILKRNELRCGIDPGYIPFEMTDKTGKFIGFEIDLARELAKAMGVKFVPVNMGFDGIIPALNTDKLDIITAGMTVTQERNLQVNFADPIVTVGQTVIVNKKFLGKVKSYKDLNSPEYTIVAKLGTTGEQAAKRYIPRANYKSFDTEPDAAMAVVNGQADAMVYDFPFNALFMAEHGKKKLFFLDKPFTYEPIAWGIHKGDPDFLNFLNNFLRQIKNDGRYKKIYTKWFKNTNWKKSLQ